MRPHAPRTLIALGVAAAVALAAGCGDDETTASGPTFSRPTRIDNPYSPLSAFRRCELRGTAGGAGERVVRTLLDRTEPFTVGGKTVRTAVIEDRAYEDGILVERTLDYFAQADDGTVHYFGERVDNYENGKVADHRGTWLYGRDTDRLGVLMPADPQVGDRWRFEDVPGNTIENDRVTQRIPQVRAGGRTYTDVLRVREHLQYEGDVEFKLYARGTGLIREEPPDGRVDLVRCA